MQKKLMFCGKSVVISYKKIKNMYLRISPTGDEIRISAPLNTSDAAINSFLDKSLPWLQKRLIKHEEAKKCSNYDDFSANPHCYIFGERFPVFIVESGEETVVKNESAIIIKTTKKLNSMQIQAVLKEYLREQFHAVLPTLSAECEAICRERAFEWRIRDMRTKWGTCNISCRRIWLRLALASYPVSCIKFVMLHELVHLKERNHTKRFYSLLNDYMPNGEAIEKILKDDKYIMWLAQ